MQPEKYIVRRIPGTQTTSGPGDTVVDNNGNYYRVVTDGEASIIRTGTVGRVYTILPNGTIR